MQIAQGQYLYSYLQNFQIALEQDIQTVSENELLKVSDDSYIDSLMQKYSIDPIQLHLDREEITTYQRQIYTQDLTPSFRFGNDPQPLFQKIVIYHLPFSGDARLFQYDLTSSCRMSLPKLTINNGKISFEVIFNEIQSNQAENTINTYRSLLQQQVGYINIVLVSYNTSLKKRIQQSIGKKKRGANKLSEVLSSIGIPIWETQEIKTKNLPVEITPIANETYYSVAISYSDFYKIVATMFNDFLKTHGVKTRLYPNDELVGS